MSSVCSWAWICALLINRDVVPAKTNKTRRAIKAVAKSPATRRKGKYVLRLFVAGATDKSRLRLGSD
jgi:hypothetical protein